MTKAQAALTRALTSPFRPADAAAPRAARPSVSTTALPTAAARQAAYRAQLTEMRFHLQHDSVRDLKGQQARAPKAKEQSRSLAKLIGKPSLTDEPETRTAHATLAKLSTIPAKQRAVMHTDDLLRIATEILTPLVKERVAREDARRGFAPRK